MSSVVKRLEIIECNIFDQTKEIESLHCQIHSKDKELQDLKTKLKDSEKRTAEILNEHEQYSRRNNLRITGLQGDEEFQSSIALTEQVSSLLSSKLGLRVEKEDIDIAHRIGKHHREKIRPVIVRFIRRQTKSDVMRNAKLLKGSGIFLNEDLTKLNAEVLASVRVKDPETVERAWSFDGKLYARFRGKEH